MVYDWDRIIAGMGQADDSVRLSAAHALEQALKAELEAGRTDWTQLAQALLPGLMEGIGDRHKGVQVHSANCLQFLAYQYEGVIPALRAALRPAEAWRAWGAAIVFARLGLWTADLGPALSAAIGAQDRDVRWAAASYTLQLGRNHPEAVATVIESLRSGEPLTRKMAAYCLGAMGAYADVEAALVEQLDDPEMEVRRAVIMALQKLPTLSPTTQEKVAALRQDENIFVQRTAEAVARGWGL